MRTNVIFNPHKYTAGMCLSVYVNDYTFGRVICHSAGDDLVKPSTGSSQERFSQTPIICT